MLKILSPGQIKELDHFTIVNEPISSIDLMDRACKGFVDWFVLRYNGTLKVGIICGTGNNGGDGLGIARMLKDWGYKVSVWIVRGSVPESQDFKINLSRLEGKIEINEILDRSIPDDFNQIHVVIDAIFGISLTRPVEGIYEFVIEKMNLLSVTRIAVDMPSGLQAENKSEGAVINAHHTVSFQVPKLAFFMPENNRYVGEWHLIDIGLSSSLLEQMDTTHFFVTHADIKKLIKLRSKYDHKGKYGHALLLAGSYGKMGACILSSRAAMRSGVGLLTVHIPKSGYSIIQLALPEAMVEADASDEYFSNACETSAYHSIGIGPGLGKNQETVRAFKKLLENFRKPIVIDADGLNILSEHREMISMIPEGSILTPHPKEFERLAGPWKNDFDRLEKLGRFSNQVKSVIVLKGANSSIALPDGNIYFNPTGNPGMATGGSGDVLTGILTGILAQGYSSKDTALMGVFLHGLAGDLAARDRGVNSLIASDLIEYLSAAFRKLV